MDCDPAGQGAKPTALLRQYNPDSKAWEPLKTTWFGNTASASVDRFARPKAYLAILGTLSAPALSDIRWVPTSALEGNWEGKSAPSASITVEGGGSKAAAVADGDGRFSVPFTLGWEPAEYLVRAVPLEGDSLAVEHKISGRPATMERPVDPRLSVEARYDAGDYLLISCEDKGLLSFASSGPRSLSARVLSKDGRETAFCELKEVISGSGMFLGRMDASQLVDKQGHSFPQPLTVEVGGQLAGVTLRDTVPPEIVLDSPTHPSFLYLSGSEGRDLRATRVHSRSKVERTGGTWRIMGAGREPSAREVSWPVGPFPSKEWPIIGFTYRLFEPAPWQLHIRSGMELAAYHFDPDDSADLGLPVYARSTALIADGHWHYWQGNLQDGKFDRITGLAFGSWVKTGFRRVDPGFKGNASQILEIRDILVGRASRSPNVEIRWKIHDCSPIKDIAWWVDHETESQPSSKTPLLSSVEVKPKTMEQTCNIRLPGDGRWFFHMQATDEAGNVSRTFNYPLFVFGTGSPAPNEHVAPSALTWNQPEGKVELRLAGWGNSLDANTLVLTFKGVSFPVGKPIWNAGAETLTLDGGSFPGGAPLGFDQEEVTFEISGKDISGKPIDPPQSFQVKIQSIFSWLPQEGGGRISSSDKKSQWLAAWEQPAAPWRKFFPGAANNILLMMKMPAVKPSGEVSRWRRPVVLSDGRCLFLRESLNTPGFDWVEASQTNGLPVFDASGASLSPMSNSATGDTWITQLSGSDSFQTGRMRVTLRRGRQLEQRIVDEKQLQFLLDSQAAETLRIDAWLRPPDGILSLEIPGERRVFIGDENELKWRKTKLVSLDAGKRWRRVSVLVIPKTTYKKSPGAKVTGQTCW